MISIDRPGLGISTPMPGRTFADTVDALARFGAARGLSAPAMVGNPQGAPFVLACAAAGITGAVAIVSGADEVAAPCFAQPLPVDLRALVDRVATDPAGAETMFARWNPEAMWQMVTMSSPVSDLQIYQDPVFDDTYRRALVQGFARGSAGYARDTVLAMSRWPFDLSQITVRVDLWYGAEDTALSSCLVCSSFRVQQAIARSRRSCSEGLFGDLIPHLESDCSFGAVIGGSHPVPVASMKMVYEPVPHLTGVS
ncbi:hypothetical protein [Rhodococcus jostii]|uniref:hypothetical protein n=1 Tax=Rhodococcus jostii TaxID=132919 RepID=UPI00363AEC7C